MTDPYRRTIRAPRLAATTPLLTALALAFAASPAVAVDRTLIATGDWIDGANWNPASEPGINDNAFLASFTATLDVNRAILGLFQSSGSVTGVGSLTVADTSTWSGGSQTGSGSTTFSGALTLDGGTKTINGRAVSASDTTWNAGAMNIVNGSFNNTGSFDDATVANTTVFGSTSGSFNNSGTYNKLNDTVTTVNPAFNNTGTVNVDAGTLRLSGGGAHTGGFDVDTGAELAMYGGNHNLNSGASVTGSGTLRAYNGTTSVNAGANLGDNINLALNFGTFDLAIDEQIASVDQVGGTITGAGALTVTGASTLSGGSQAGSGSTTFSGALTLDGGTKTISGRTVSASNTMWNAGAMNIVSGSFNNTGSFDDATVANTTVFGSTSGSFNNSGTYNKLNDTVTTVNPAFNNTGTTSIAAGTMAFTGAIDNTGGLIEGVGTLKTPFTGFSNTGTIAPGLGGTGTLTVDGDLVLDPTSVLAFELASLTDFDELFLTGDITVGGTLEINSLGGYMPTINDSFQIITFAESINDQTFDNVTWNGFSDGVVLDVLYNADNITLAVAAIPEPEQYLMMLAGLGLIGAVARRRRAQI